MKTAVITLAMKRDFPHAHLSVASLEQQLSASVRHFVLLNDEHDSEIATAIDSHPHREYSCSGSNIGVAAGRNALIGQAISWGAGRVVVFDDDLLAPRDYLSCLLEAHSKLTRDDPETGVIAPAVLSYAFASSALLSARQRRALLRLESTTVGSTRSWQRRLGRMDEIPGPGEIEHLGVTDWERHYLSVGRRAVARWLESIGFSPPSEPAHPTVVANMKWARREVANAGDGAIRVDTVPGGVWCLSTDVLREVGSIDEGFSPFGFEDADWCIRAIRKGFHNYVAPDVLVVHDIQSRLAERPSSQVMASRGRARGLLIARHMDTNSVAEGTIQAFAEAVDAQSYRDGDRGEAAIQFLRHLLPALPHSITATPGDADPVAGSKAGTAPSMSVDCTVTPDRLELHGLSVIWSSVDQLSASASVADSSRFDFHIEVAGSKAIRALSRTLLGDAEFAARSELAGAESSSWLADLFGAATHVLAADCLHPIKVTVSAKSGAAKASVRHRCLGS